MSLLEATVSDDPMRRKVIVRWSDTEINEYHYVWLRHSARCSSGMPNDISIKIDLLPDDPADLGVKQVSVTGNALIIDWQDQYLQTSHDLETLRTSAYDEKSRRSKKPTPVLWDNKSADDIPVFEYESLQRSQTVLELQIVVRDYGLAKIRNVPTISDTIVQVGEHFGPIHVNNYGRIFDVKIETNVSLGSNTGAYLGPHTDESYRHAAPGISFFHCLIASTAGGGESILVDGFKVAESLKQEDPNSFGVLTTVPIFFQRKVLPEENMQSHQRMITTDIDGDVEGIRFTDRTLPPQDLPDQYVEPVYKAIKAFWKICNREQLKHTYFMRPGDLHIFDNQRVLHGRNDFDPSKTTRHLQQCSVNRDEFHNTLRTLAAKLGDPSAELTMAGGALG